MNFRPSEADRDCSYRKGTVEAVVEDDYAWWRRSGRRRAETEEEEVRGAGETDGRRRAERAEGVVSDRAGDRKSVV